MNRSIAPPLHAPYRYSAIEPIVGPRDLTLLRVFDRLRSEDVALCTMTRQQGVDVQSAAAEFAKLGSIDHPLLARVRDFGATDELVFYSRELGLPTTLQNLSAAELDEGTLYSLLLAASEGMEALHEAGLVHGLVLPEHVQVSMVDGAFGGMRLADAGLRRLLPSSSLKRRERYDPPEMRNGADVSPASDIYQLGTTLLEVLGGGSPSGAISRGTARRSSPTAGGTDKNLRDLLGRLVDPDPHRRYASGRELRRSLSAMDWALPDRTADVSSLVTPLMVGREREMGHLVAALKRAVAAEVHAVEVVGPGGMGRTRVLRELAVRAGEEGWNAVLVGGRAGEKAIEDALSSKREAKSLLLVDNADQLHPDVLAQLRFLVAEAGTSPVLVVSTAVTAVGLPGADVIALDPLGVRDLKRLIEPMLLSALNPEVALQAVDASAGGNPLWVKLLLASWQETGRLRFVHGRPFFDERQDAGVPDSIAGIVFRIVDGMSRSERDLVEAMAIWGAPLPMAVAKRVLSDNPEVASALVRTDGGDYRFIGDTVGPVVVGLLSQERQRHWHSAFLSVLAEDELGGRQRALHLLGAGRSAEAIRALVDEGIAAEKRRDYRVAFVSLRDAFERYPSDDVQGIERARLALDAARLATLVGEPHWARVVLESTRPESADPPSLRLEHMVLQANVLRELRDAAGAAALYVQAKELIARHPGLQDQVIPVQLEETANDAMRGEGQKAIRQVEAIVKSVEAEKPTPLLGLALQRAGSLYARLGRPRASLVYELRSLRTARRLGDHQLAARALVNLGHLYWVLGRPRRALLALRQVENELASCPHDGIAASELMNRADVFMGTGRSDEAYTLLLHARALRERAGERGRLATTLILLGSLSQHGGRLADGARYYREAIALAEEFELPVVRAAQSNLGELHLQMGAWDEAERLLRIGLSNPKPDQRGLTLVNLGRLRREQGRYQDALQFLAEAEQLLAGFSRRYRAYAVLETARVLFAAGDVEGASFHLLQVRDDVASDQELRIGYQVLDGLIASVRGEEAERAFKAALSTLQESQDPTLVAEALIAILERALASSEMNPAWFAHQLEVLEDAASRTDARQLMMQARVIRARFAERCAASSDDRGLAEKLRQSVEQGTSGVEAAIGELLRDLPGAAGAAVFVVGVDGQGRPMVSALPKSSKAPDTRIRPYRVAVREFDRDVFRRALGASGGNVHEAARKLRLPTSTFRYRAIKLGLLNPTPREK